MRSIILLCIVTCMVATLSGCAGDSDMTEDQFEQPSLVPGEEAEIDFPVDEGLETENEIERVLRKHEDTLMAIMGVVGVGIQTSEAGDDVIVVYVSDETVAQRIPQTLDGYPVETAVSGEIEAQ